MVTCIRRVFSQFLKSTSGFSLLELLVVISLTSVLAGGGFFAFTQYARTQTMNQAVEGIKLVYDQARNYAVSNVKPEHVGDNGCVLDGETLKGYRVDLSTNTYTLVINCKDIEPPSIVSKLPSDITIDDTDRCSGVEFVVLTGDVKPSPGGLPCRFKVKHEQDSNLNKEIEIQKNGRLVIK